MYFIHTHPDGSMRCNALFAFTAIFLASAKIIVDLGRIECVHNNSMKAKGLSVGYRYAYFPYH
jgi:hypothetical protein